MLMKRQTLNTSASLPLLLLLAAGGVVADEQATDQQQALGDAPAPAYTYNDDWGLVSAPPPQGPYNAINLDPRIPGQDLVIPMPMPDIGSQEVPGSDTSAPEAPASASEAASSASVTPSTPGQSSLPPQTPYDYQPQAASQGRPPQAQASPAPQTAVMPEQAALGYAQRPGGRAYGRAGTMNAPYPGAGMHPVRPQPAVAPEQHMGYESRPLPGYYRSQDYSQSGARPMYGYPWPSRHPSSGYPDAGYSQSPWQGGDPRAPEIEVPPPSVYNRMMAEPPPARYAPPPGMMQYYGGGR
jgi:hypothetical protein